MPDSRLRTSDFDYPMPERLIAQTPVATRDAARLLHVDRARAALSHRHFSELPRLLQAGDLLVLNDTRVFPARIHAIKETGGRVELLLLRRVSPPSVPAGGDGDGAEMWEALARGARRLRPGTRLSLADGFVATVHDIGGERVRLRVTPGGVLDFLEHRGSVPLPPYIRRDPDDAGAAELAALDRSRYQTVFARETGAVAAPTAGLHFTDELLQALRAAGISIATVTLHVGRGTFRPVREGDLSAHRMHAERFAITTATATAIAEARRVVAVGTTVARALESSGGAAGTGETDLFITPGHRWRAVDALITNFHLPRSTLLMLVASILPAWRDAYAEATREGYRFYSYGDAMFIDRETCRGR